MCGAKRGLLLCLSFFILLSAAAGALRAEEEDRWYLISERELLSIEAYLAKSEREKQSWLSQARGLVARIENLEKLSENLNEQLKSQRTTNLELSQSFNEYESGNLAAISSKNGEIGGLKQALAEKALEAEKYKGLAALRLAVIIAIGATVAGYVVIRVLRRVRVIPV